MEAVLGRANSDAAQTAKLADPMVSALLIAAQESKAAAKWITAAFAAVGAVLITGLSLSDLGDLPISGVIIASAGASLGILGVLLVIVFAMRVLASRFVVLAEFADVGESTHMSGWDVLNPAPSQKLQLRWVLDRLERNRSLATRHGESVVDLISQLDQWEDEQVWARRDAMQAEALYQKANSDLDAAQQKYDELSNSQPGEQATTAAGQALAKARQGVERTKSKLSEARHELQEARSEVRDFGRLAERLRASAQYEYVTVRFDTSRFWIVASGILASVGVLMFALATAVS